MPTFPGLTPGLNPGYSPPACGDLPPTPFETWLTDVQPFAWPAVGLVALALAVYLLAAKPGGLRGRVGGLAAQLAASGFLGFVVAGVTFDSLPGGWEVPALAYIAGAGVGVFAIMHWWNYYLVRMRQPL